MEDTTYTVDMISLPHDIKHQKLFGTIGSMQSGETLRIINDHDPKPLHFRLTAQNPGGFGWKYEQEGPDVWKVIITRN